jgi:hypothetical protein
MTKKDQREDQERPKGRPRPKTKKEGIIDRSALIFRIQDETQIRPLPTLGKGHDRWVWKELATKSNGRLNVIDTDCNEL